MGKRNQKCHYLTNGFTINGNKYSLNIYCQCYNPTDEDKVITIVITDYKKEDSATTTSAASNSNRYTEATLSQILNGFPQSLSGLSDRVKDHIGDIDVIDVTICGGGNGFDALLFAKSLTLWPKYKTIRKLELIELKNCFRGRRVNLNEMLSKLVSQVPQIMTWRGCGSVLNDVQGAIVNTAANTSEGGCAVSKRSAVFWQCLKSIKPDQESCLKKLSIDHVNAADCELLFAILLSSELRNYKKLIERCTPWDSKFIRQLVLARRGRAWRIPSEDQLCDALFSLSDKVEVDELRSIIRSIEVLDLSNSDELIIPTYEGGMSDDEALFESSTSRSSSMSDPEYSAEESDGEFLCNDSSLDESVYELVLRKVRWTDLTMDHMKELYLDNTSYRTQWSVNLLEDLLTSACNLEVLSLGRSNWKSATTPGRMTLKIRSLQQLNLSQSIIQNVTVLTEDFLKLLTNFHRPTGLMYELVLDLRQVETIGSDPSNAVEMLSKALRTRRSKIAITVLAEPIVNNKRSTANSSPDVFSEIVPSPEHNHSIAFGNVYQKNASLSALGTHAPRVSFSNLKDGTSLIHGVGDLVMILLEQRHLSLGNILNRQELTTLVSLTQGRFPAYITSSQENSVQMLALSCLEELTTRSLSMKLALLDRLDEDDDIILGDATHQITFIAPAQLRFCCSSTEAESSFYAMDDASIKPVIIIDARGDAHLRRILSSARATFGTVASALSMPSPDICDKGEASIESYALMLKDLKTFVEKKIKSKKKVKIVNRTRVYLGQPSDDPMHEALLLKLLCDLLGLKSCYRRVRDNENHHEADIILNQVFVRIPRLAGRDNLISINWGCDATHSDIDNHHRFSAIYDLNNLLSDGCIVKENIAMTKRVSTNENKLNPHHLQAVNLDAHFQFHEKKGEGTFGTVYAVSSKSYKVHVLPEPARKKRRISQIGHLFSSVNMDIDVEMFALKLISLENVDDLRDAQEEVAILKMFNHPRLIPCFNIFYGYREDNEDALILCCLMELCDCSLEEFIRDKVSDRGVGVKVTKGAEPGKGPDSAWKLLLLLDACRGMCHLHDPKQGMSEQIILHRDLKPGNILLSYKKKGQNKQGLVRAMIADFGVATFRPLRNIKQANEAFSPMTQEPGTHAYMAPEQAKSSAYDRPADVYGFGMIVVRLIGIVELPKQKKLKELRIKEIVEKLQKLELNEDQYLQTLASRCLQQSPHDRPTFHDIARSLVLEIMDRTTRCNI